jgi:hypothetical protein
MIAEQLGIGMMARGWTSARGPPDRRTRKVPTVRLHRRTAATEAGHPQAQSRGCPF